MARRLPPNYKQMRKETDTALKVIKEQRRKCTCGHAIDFKGYFDYKICTWCGKRVYIDPKDQFKYEVEKKLKERKNV